MAKNILTARGEMSANYFPLKGGKGGAETEASRNLVANAKENKPKPRSRFDLFRESREALLDGDTGMSQILLVKTVDDKSYGQTQYALDLVLVYSSEPLRVRRGGEEGSRPGGGRRGRVEHLRSLLEADALPLHVYHSRQFFNSVTGILLL